MEAEKPPRLTENVSPLNPASSSSAKLSRYDCPGVVAKVCESTPGLGAVDGVDRKASNEPVLGNAESIPIPPATTLHSGASAPVSKPSLATNSARAPAPTRER